MPSEAADAIVLRSFDYGETSQVLHLFTRELGRVHGLAKGSRRLKSSFRGGADLLTIGRAAVYARRGAAELRVIGSFDVTEPLAGLRRRIARFAAGNHVAAILLAFTQEDQPHPELWDLAAAALRLACEADDDGADALAVGFEAMALRVLGFAPELGRCVNCARPARNVRTARLSALRGGLLCSACRGEDRRGVELTGGEIAALRGLAAGPLLDAAGHARDPSVRRSLRDALDRWSETLLDRPLRTARRGNGGAGASRGLSSRP